MNSMFHYQNEAMKDALAAELAGIVMGIVHRWDIIENRNFQLFTLCNEPLRT